MDVDEVVKWLRTEFGEDSQAGVIVLSATNDPVTGQRAERPVLDVSIDESEREVLLMLNQHPDDQQATLPLSVASFLAKLGDLPPTCGTFGLYSGSWRRLPGGRNMRTDWPLEDIAFNEDRSCVAFVERALAGR